LHVQEQGNLGEGTRSELLALKQQMLPQETRVRTNSERPQGDSTSEGAFLWGMHAPVLLFKDSVVFSTSDE
jgi:hypothetical protein